MNTAQKIYENFIDTHGTSRDGDLTDYVTKERGVVIEWGYDYYSDNIAQFKDGSAIYWNYKNEIGVF